MTGRGAGGGVLFSKEERGAFRQLPRRLPSELFKAGQQTPGAQYNQWLLGDLVPQLWSGGVGALGLAPVDWITP